MLSPRSESPSSINECIELPRAPSPISIERGKAIRRSQFHTLLSIFDRTIIRTFKSRYTQFLVFWYSSLDSEFSDLFQGFLVSKALLEQDQPTVTRAAAASYIASFVSRAQFVDREDARRVTGLLCTFLRNHLDLFDTVLQSGTSMPSMGHHSVFYAVAQAVFLIFCFRWRDLEEEPEDADELLGAGAGKKWMPELSVVQRVVTSSFNPLKVANSISR
jgi:RNA polymerase I-specific transcription initiation factor RRN3